MIQVSSPILVGERRVGLQHATDTSPCYSQWRILLATPWHSEPLDMFLSNHYCWSVPSCRLLGHRKRWSTTRKDEKSHLFRYLLTNVKPLYNKHLREKLEESSEITYNFSVYSGGRDLGQGFPKPRATCILLWDACGVLIYMGNHTPPGNLE